MKIEQEPDDNCGPVNRSINDRGLQLADQVAVESEGSAMSFRQLLIVTSQDTSNSVIARFLKCSTDLERASHAATCDGRENAEKTRDEVFTEEDASVRYDSASASTGSVQPEQERPPLQSSLQALHDDITGTTNAFKEGSLLDDRSPDNKSRKKMGQSSQPLLHQYYHNTLQQLISITSSQARDTWLDDTQRNSLKHALSLLYMWAQGIDLQHIEINANIGDDMRKVIWRALQGIQSALTTNGIFANSSLPTLEARSSLEHGIQAHMMAFTEDYDSEANDSEEDYSSPSQSSLAMETSSSHFRGHTLFHGNLAQSIELIAAHVTNLMDLLPTLSSLNEIATESTFEKGGAKRTISSQAATHVQPFVRQIYDKFEQIAPYLADRLAEANWTRFRHVSQQQNAVKSIRNFANEVMGCEVPISEAEPSTFHPVSRFQDSGLGASVSAPTKYAESNASHVSFVSTQSAAQRGATRAPPTPSEVETGLPLYCSFCQRQVAGIKNRAGWKMHFFSDIKAYVCTFSECSQSNFTFPSRKMWYEHELRNHRSRLAYKCSACSLMFENADMLIHHLQHIHSLNETTPEQASIISASSEVLMPPQISTQSCSMCNKSKFSNHREFRSHVGRHLEEIALISIPKEADTDTEDELASRFTRSTSSNRSSINTKADDDIETNRTNRKLIRYTKEPTYDVQSRLEDQQADHMGIPRITEANDIMGWLNSTQEDDKVHTTFHQQYVPTTTIETTPLSGLQEDFTHSDDSVNSPRSVLAVKGEARADSEIQKYGRRPVVNARREDYECSYCHKKFARRSTLKRHEQSMHGPTVIWVCQLSSTNSDGLQACYFCQLEEPKEDCPHRLDACKEKPQADRSYYREDAFMQHLMVVHGVSRELIRGNKVDLKQWEIPHHEQESS